MMGYLQDIYYISVSHNEDHSLENEKLERYYLVVDSFKNKYVLDCNPYTRLFKTLKKNQVPETENKNFKLCFNNTCEAKKGLEWIYNLENKYFSSTKQIEESYKNTLSFIRTKLPREMFCEIGKKIKSIIEFRDYLNSFNFSKEDKNKCYKLWAEKNIKKIVKKDKAGYVEEYYGTDTEKHGKYISFENGKKDIEANYNFNELDGEYKKWWNNGKRRIYATYKNGKIIGNYNELSKDGDQPLVSAFYNENGNLEGNYWSFYNNGQIQTNANYKDGKLEGKFEKRHEDGSIAISATYKNGELDGSYEEDNLESHIKTTYKNGKLHGQYREHFRIGNRLALINYKDGQLDGHYKVTIGRGKIREEGTYIKGKPHGMYKILYMKNIYEIKFYYNGNEILEGIKIYEEKGKPLIFMSGNKKTNMLGSKGEKIENIKQILEYFSQGGITF